jgi:hypothetical protein
MDKMAEDLAEEEAVLADALITIASRYGKFNEDETGIWAGYDSPEENEVKSIGVKCANCVLYEGDGVCKIIAQEVEEEGKCRFAVIPDGVVNVEKNRNITDVRPELDEYVIDQELNISLKNKEDYETVEDAIFAMTEYLGYGYEAEPAIRASWLRAVKNGEDPFLRASLLASLGEGSLDADLLPVLEEEGEV